MKEKNSDCRRNLTSLVVYSTTKRLSQHFFFNNHQFIRDELSFCQSRIERKMPLSAVFCRR